MRLREENAIPSEDKQPRKESLGWLNRNKNDKSSRLQNVCHRSARGKLYAGGAIAVVIVVAAAMALWFSGMVGTKDTDVKKIVSLGIQGKRQLNVGEKTILRVGGRFSDGSEAAVTKNLDWQSSEDSVVAVSQDGQVEARKDGFTDITVRYEGITSPPLTLVVRGESRSTEADPARVAAQSPGAHQDSRFLPRPGGIFACVGRTCKGKVLRSRK